jgi:hypothetical protein
MQMDLSDNPSAAAELASTATADAPSGAALGDSKPAGQ